MDGSTTKASEDMPLFTMKMAGAATAAGPRLGTLSLRGKRAIDTPNYIPISSRGVVPHLSQDMMKKHTNIQSVYVALEDFIEKGPAHIPPVYELARRGQDLPLRRFIALPNTATLILGARRSPPVFAPAANTSSAISILTSVGFRQLPAEEYAEAAQMLSPDIVIALGDLVYGAKPSSKRIEKMGDRSTAWLNQLIQEQQLAMKDGQKFPHIFAPIHPVPLEQQASYVDKLAEEMRDSISGLAIYDCSSTHDLPRRLNTLPRLSLSEAANPNQLLRDVSLGIDLFTIPFISAATDAGIALDFNFPPTSADTQPGHRKPLGIDMWSASHATDVSPLADGCTCYACMKHHRAYLQHLLAAKEMLGWVLLQVHNHHILDEFFAGVRGSIASGTFEQDMAAFEKTYERELPEKTGQGPRVRGYQFKSEGPGEPKKNARAYQMLDDAKEKLEESSLPSPDASANNLKNQGFATPQSS